MLVALSECDEVGLGHSHRREGHRIGPATAAQIVSLFKEIPEYEQSGFVHFEEIQFFVDHVSKDRISDFSCNFLKSFLIDYTIQQCETLKIPMSQVSIEYVYSYKENKLKTETGMFLPINPESTKPIIFVPKRWLRFGPWLDFDEYYRDYCPRDRIQTESAGNDRVSVLTFNRRNYGVVRDYVKVKERNRAECANDPLFSQIPISSAKTSLKIVRDLPTGLHEGNDKKYERETSRLLASALYPQLDFADHQVRTDSGVQIRDLIFYNTQSNPFLEEVFAKYDTRQIVMELKNVRQVEREHINQLNRYLSEQFGRFGILVTRNPLPKPMFQNTIDLWSGQRRCIITIDDQDLELMANLYESKQRDPIDVLNKKYAEFIRACPS